QPDAAQPLPQPVHLPLEGVRVGVVEVDGVEGGVDVHLLAQVMGGALAEEIDLVPTALQLQCRAVPLSLGVAYPLLGAGDRLAGGTLGRGSVLPRGTR